MHDDGALLVFPRVAACAWINTDPRFYPRRA
jgi:hypothetical protein